ncbi:MAG: hypothetical protein Q7Q71_06240 [Verrucomicrobiota bacterium JB023]|nr:hypothetical protein [Verrucomicrobiota bacterium JB023]
MDFINNLPIDQIGLTVGMVIIVLLFAVVTIIKGILKMILTLFSLGVAGAAFLFGYLQSPPYIDQFVPEAGSWMPLVAGGICALIALVLIQLLLGLFSGKKKSAKPESGEAGSSKGRRNPLAPLFGFVTGVIVLYLVLTALRYGVSRAELDYLRQVAEQGIEEAGPRPLPAQVNQWLDDSPIASFHDRINPFFDSARLNLAKLMILADNTQLFAKARRNEENEEAMQVPEVKSICLLSNTQRELIREGKYNELFSDPRFLRIAKRPSIERELLGVDLGVLFEKEKTEDE